MSPGYWLPSWRASLPLSSSLLSSNRCAPPLRHRRNWHRPRYCAIKVRSIEAGSGPASRERASPVSPVRVSVRQRSDVPDARVCLARAAASLAVPTAYGDLTAATLSLVALTCIRHESVGPDAVAVQRRRAFRPTRTSRRSRITSIPVFLRFLLSRRAQRAGEDMVV